jgi:hypothetical protein
MSAHLAYICSEVKSDSSGHICVWFIALALHYTKLGVALGDDLACINRAY